MSALWRVCVASALLLGTPGIAAAWDAAADVSFTLDNGVRGALTAWSGERVAAVTIQVDAGSRDDPAGAPQLAHLVEHLMFRFDHDGVDHGTRLAELGAVGNAFTGPDATRYVTIVPASELDELLRLQAACFGGLPEGIDEADVEAEKAVLLREESERTVDNPWGELGPVIMQRLFPEDHPYHLARVLDVDAFDRIGLADVERFWTDHYGPGAITVAVVGDVDAAAVKARVSQLFGSLPGRAQAKRPVAVVPRPAAGRFHYVRQESDWSRLYLSWVTPPAVGTEACAWRTIEPLLLAGKPSWLVRELHEDDKIAWVDGAWRRFDLAGVFTLEIAYPLSSSLAEVLSALRSGLARQQKEGVVRREMQLASWRAWLEIREALEAPLQLASWLAGRWPRSQGAPDSYDDLVREWGDLEFSEVERIVDAVLQPEGMSIVLAGPRLELPPRSVWSPITSLDLDLDEGDDEEDDK